MNLCGATDGEVQASDRSGTSHEREGEPLGNEGFLTGPHVVGLLLALAFCNQYL